MEANELMIGDWVNFGSFIRQVIQSDYYQDVNGDCVLDGVKPIPLTPEMLEKNGWYVPLLKSWWEHPDIAFWMKGYTDGTFELMIDEDSDISFCTIRYVHELQRALRCCGLFDKANDIVV